MRYALAAMMCLAIAGCATTMQSVKTMDGDEFKQVGGSLFSKQKYMHGIDADFYPNNSGAHIAVKGEGDQDATSMIPLLQALIGALAAERSAPNPESPSRIEALNDRIEAMQSIIDTLKRPRE